MSERLMADFAFRFAKSRALFQRANQSLAAGINSNLRHSLPYPLFVEQAHHARKTTADKVELLDYWMGHGALLFGHTIPEWDLRLAEHLQKGRHFSALTEEEVTLAEKVVTAVPFAEKVRFCGTGSESVALSLRLARAYTNRHEVVKIAGHYHGWHDELVHGILPFLDGKYRGVPNGAQTSVRVVPPNRLDLLETALENAAALILEPAGGMTGVIPHSSEYLKAARALCDKTRTLLIFDEMVSGFRFALGGAAEYYGVHPDLATYGKVLFGGFPGGALAGKNEIMQLLGPDLQKQVAHQGTWNAAPLAMASGNLVLDLLLAKGKTLYPELTSKAVSLRHKLKAVLDGAGISGQVSGESSIVHLTLVDSSPPPATLSDVSETIRGRMTARNLLLRPAMLLEGVDLSTAHMNVISTAHQEADFDETGQRPGASVAKTR